MNKYKVRTDEDRSWVNIESHSAESAAEDVCENQIDESHPDYYPKDGIFHSVEVEGPDGKIEKFRVEVEWVVSCYAEPAE